MLFVLRKNKRSVLKLIGGAMASIVKCVLKLTQRTVVSNEKSLKSASITVTKTTQVI